MTEHPEDGQVPDEPAPGVRNEVSGVVHGSVVQASTIAALHFHAASRQSSVPRQLPARPWSFCGRLSDLDALSESLEHHSGNGQTIVVSAVAGAGGIGKTWLALYWAYQHLDQFPDGQLFVDLRGYSPGEEPLAPETAVRGFLDALGVTPEQVPREIDAQIGLYRSLMADKRVLLMLDNARDAAQVIALLPGTPTCTVLITSRDQMAGLVTAHGVSRIALDVLDEHDARSLLAGRLGDERVAAEPEAIADLLSYCAGLPLALSIVASRARPQFPLQHLARSLQDTVTRLATLDDGEAASLPTVLSWSYATLTAAQAELLGLLALAPGPDISASAAASLSGLPDPQTKIFLRALERASLIYEHIPGRFRMHDLVRLYAANRATRDLPTEHRDLALRRLVIWYTQTAFAADRLLNPHRPPIAVDALTSHPLPDEQAALAWLTDEHACLLAAQRLAAEQGWHDLAWQLAWSLSTFHWRRGHHHDELATTHLGVASASQLDDPVTQSAAQRLAGNAYMRLGQHTEARVYFMTALEQAEEDDNLLEQALTHRLLASSFYHQEKIEEALQHITIAFGLFQTLGNPVLQAEMLNAMGWYELQRGNRQQASTYCEAALALYRREHDPAGVANTLDSLGLIAHQSGQYLQAIGHYQQALKGFRGQGNIYYEADTLDRLGTTQAALDQREDARQTWRLAIQLYTDQHKTSDAERVQKQLDAL